MGSDSLQAFSKAQTLQGTASQIWVDTAVPHVPDAALFGLWADFSIRGYTRQAAIRPNKLSTADSDKRKRPIRSAASRSPYSKKRYGNDSPENGPLLTLLERKPVQPAPGHEAISYQATGLMLWAFLRSGSLGVAGKACAETRRQAGHPCPKTA